MMYIARILYPVKVLGPGNRIGIWMNGCEFACKGCSNPELWRQQSRYKVPMNAVSVMIDSICANHCVDGFTLTGGEPFYQPEALEELLPYLSSINQDVLVYTGYEYGHIQNKYIHLLKYISVLIDGKYIDERNKGLVLRGSDNQNIYFLMDKYKAVYQLYIQHTRSRIQNFSTVDGVISVGIHLPGYGDQIRQMMEKKGLEELSDGGIYS